MRVITEYAFRLSMCVTAMFLDELYLVKWIPYEKGQVQNF